MIDRLKPDPKQEQAHYMIFELFKKVNEIIDEINFLKPRIYQCYNAYKKTENDKSEIVAKLMVELKNKDDLLRQAVENFNNVIGGKDD